MRSRSYLFGQANNMTLRVRDQSERGYSGTTLTSLGGRAMTRSTGRP
jgi:hypothetical protein